MKKQDWEYAIDVALIAGIVFLLAVIYYTGRAAWTFVSFHLPRF